MNIIFAVFDTKAETYSAPFTKLTKGLAIRDFTDAANNSDNMIGKYPHDYALFQIGTWDETCGKITTEATPINIGLAIEYQEQDDAPPWPKDATGKQ